MHQASFGIMLSSSILYVNVFCLFSHFIPFLVSLFSLSLYSLSILSLYLTLFICLSIYLSEYNTLELNQEICLTQGSFNLLCFNILKTNIVKYIFVLHKKDFQNYDSCQRLHRWKQNDLFNLTLNSKYLKLLHISG